jgi:hypothetical protein
MAILLIKKLGYDELSFFYCYDLINSLFKDDFLFNTFSINTKEYVMSDGQPENNTDNTLKNTAHLETLAIHAGYTVEPTTKSVAVPIYHTSSYAFDNTQHGADLFDLKVAGNIYTRIMNPTNAVLEERVAALEGGIGALAVASGMAAITYAIQTICEAGDNIVAVTAPRYRSSLL